MLNQIMSFQTAINLFNAGLVVDGKPGPRTITALRAASSLIQPETYNQIQRVFGRASWFGGPNDPGDYYEGQSFFPVADPDGSGPKPALYTPADYYERICPADLRRYLNPEMATAKEWAIRGGKRVGVSFYLLPGAAPPDGPGGEPVYGCAARLGGELKRRAARGEMILLRVYNRAIVRNGQHLSVLCRPLDWGPTAVWTAALVKAAGNPPGVKVGDPWRFAIDLLKGAYDALELSGKRGADGYYMDHVWWEVLR